MTALAKPQLASSLDATQNFAKSYLESLTLLERLHRQLLDVIKDELDRRDERIVNAVQALLLFNIGDDELSAGELRTRGHYLGSNVSYNLKKLIDAGYIRHQRSSSDRRSIRVRLSDDGQRVRAIVAELFARQLTALGPVARLDPDTLEEVNDGLLRLERFWGDHIRYRL